ncbi:MAG: 3-oxoacid CoA-transferase [Anaerolineae bacterium]|nr:3-oxoacid CoA-transferase [Anaerolineae bacterium]
MSQVAPGYNLRKLQACAAARLLEDRRSVFVGTGLPMVAAMLAQRTHAPGLLIVFEAGGIGPRPPVLPISVGDSRTFYRAVAASSMHDTMSAAQAGYLDYGFLGAAQLDMYGNINTTVIGDWRLPRARLPGSGGANDLGSFCHRTIIIMAQDRRRFARKLDFLTTPGYLDGPGARERAGLPAGSGPYRVITQLGIYGFHPESKRLQLLSLHPGVTIDEVRDNSEFEILIPDRVEVTEPPTAEELRLLAEIDPLGISVGK